MSRRSTAEQWAQINALIAKARAIRPARPDTVNNGADDDGSGTVVLLEIAERFATEPAPARSMIFNFHIGEEKGLVGSKWFVDHPTIPLDKIVAAHNMDMLGKGRVTDVRYGGPASVQMLGSRRLSDDFGHVIDSINAVRDEPMVIDYSWDRTNALKRFCRSDQVSYFNKQIPVTYFSLGYAVDYHMPTDEPQYIDYEHGARVGRFVARDRAHHRQPPGAAAGAAAGEAATRVRAAGGSPSRVVILSGAREAGEVEGPLSERIGKRSLRFAQAGPSTSRPCQAASLRMTTRWGYICPKIQSRFHNIRPGRSLGFALVGAGRVAASVAASTRVSRAADFPKYARLAASTPQISSPSSAVLR